MATSEWRRNGDGWEGLGRWLSCVFYPGVAELIDLQPDKKDHSKAKKYQVRKFIEKYLEVQKYGCKI